jgi:hypothetical protein
MLEWPPPASGTRASAIGNAGIASISRYFAARRRASGGRRSTANQRADELLLRDPRRFW